MKSAIEKHLYLALLVITAIAAAMVYWVVINVREAVRTSDWVRHTHATILEMEAIYSSLTAAESAHRSYLFTKDLSHQEAYRRAFLEMSEHLQVAKALVAESPEQFAGIAQLEKLISARMDLARKLTKARDEQSLEAAIQTLAQETNVPSLQAVHNQVFELKQRENRLLQTRDQAYKANSQRTKWISFGLAAVKIGLLTVIFWLIKRDLRTRRELAHALQQANDQLEGKVQERTAELTASNRSLELEVLERRWAQSTLEQICHRNELIINSIGQPLFVLSRRGNILGVNPAAATATGLASNELVGKSFRGIVGGPARENPALDPICLAMTRNTAESEEADLRLNGHAARMHLECFPMLAENKVVGVVVTLRSADGT